MRWFLIAVLVLCSCTIDYGHEKFPLVIHVDSKFSDQEIKLIRQAIAEANRAFGERIGKDVIIYGTVIDTDFDPDVAFEDGTHVVYHVDPKSRFGRWAASVNKGSYGGWAAMEDITLNGDIELSMWLVLHEMGHFLGLLHSSRPGNIMSQTGRPDNEKYSKGDVASFCAIYYCGHNPLPPQRPDYGFALNYNLDITVAAPTEPSADGRVKHSDDATRRQNRN